jgi:hypothetical protein
VGSQQEGTELPPRVPETSDSLFVEETEDNKSNEPHQRFSTPLSHNDPSAPEDEIEADIDSLPQHTSSDVCLLSHGHDQQASRRNDHSETRPSAVKKARTGTVGLAHPTEVDGQLAEAAADSATRSTPRFINALRGMEMNMASTVSHVPVWVSDLTREEQIRVLSKLIDRNENSMRRSKHEIREKGQSEYEDKQYLRLDEERAAWELEKVRLETMK